MAVGRDTGNGVRVSGSRLTRFALALAVLAAGGLLAASALATSRSAEGLQTLNRQILAAVNRFRLAHGRVPLRESAALDSSARQHSFEMGRHGYFAHASANGTPFWRRIRRFYREGRYGYWSVGENLLWVSPTVSAERAMKLWIASTAHRENLLTTQWRQIGVSAVRVPRARGVFRGRPVTIITTDFGVRR